jgi:hypothetical protein
MHANRLLRSAQREQEAVLYDLLARYYESEVARKRRGALTPGCGHTRQESSGVGR